MDTFRQTRNYRPDILELKQFCDGMQKYYADAMEMRDNQHIMLICCSKSDVYSMLAAKLQSMLDYEKRDT